jgi:hypothetical protein
VEDRLIRIRELINLKEQTDHELETLIQGGRIEEPKVLKQRACKSCGQAGHRADTCPQKKGNDPAVTGLAASVGVA